MNARVHGWRTQAAAVLAVLLFVLRLAVPAGAFPAPGPNAALDALLRDMPICHAGADPAAPDPADRPATPAHDCTLCPVCQLAAPALLPSLAWVPLPLLAALASAVPLPPSTGPPPPARYAAPPRGPPASAV